MDGCERRYVLSDWVLDFIEHSFHALKSIRSASMVWSEMDMDRFGAGAELIHRAGIRCLTHTIRKRRLTAGSEGMCMGQLKSAGWVDLVPAPTYCHSLLWRRLFWSQILCP